MIKIEMRATSELPWKHEMVCPEAWSELDCVKFARSLRCGRGGKVSEYRLDVDGKKVAIPRGVPAAEVQVPVAFMTETPRRKISRKQF